MNIAIKINGQLFVASNGHCSCNISQLIVSGVSEVVPIAVIDDALFFPFSKENSFAVATSDTDAASFPLKFALVLLVLFDP